MSTATRPKHAWDTSTYHRMTSARYRAGELIVDFEDGTRVRLAADALLPAHVREPDWTRMAVDPYEIVVPTADGSLEIPWDDIRLLTDSAFEAHRRAKAAEENRIIGAKIKALRERKALGLEALAERAGIPIETLTDIEAGQAAASFSTLERVLAPLGADLDALVVEPAHPE
jgi:DNA-binding XRE family transcriptional regulator